MNIEQSPEILPELKFEKPEVTAQFIPLSHEMIDRICGSDLKAAEIKVLLQIMRTVNMETGACYPGYKHISEKAKLHKSTVAHSVKSLTEKGFLRYKEGGYRGGRNMANEYFINDSNFHANVFPEIIRAKSRNIIKQKPHDEDRVGNYMEELRKQLESGDLK